MATLPRLRCPGCGKGMGPVTAALIPPANTFEDCLRRCTRCGIGATNAKNPAKVKYLQADRSKDLPAQAARRQDAPPPTPPERDTAPQDAQTRDIPPQKP